jgi:hypothetical protein
LIAKQLLVVAWLVLAARSFSMKLLC